MGLSIDKLLAKNLDQIFKDRGITNAVIAEQKLRVPKSTVDRAWKCRSMARLDTLEELAAGLKLQPWQLLVPDLDSSNPPVLEKRQESPVVVAQQSMPASPEDPDGKIEITDVLQLLAGFGQLDTLGQQQVLSLVRGLPKKAALPRAVLGVGNKS